MLRSIKSDLGKVVTLLTYHECRDGDNASHVALEIVEELIVEIDRELNEGYYPDDQED